MRGSDAVLGSLFSYVDLEDRVPAKQSAAARPRDRQRGARRARCRVREDVRGVGSAFDPAGEAAARLAAAGVLHHSVRTPADGAARLQPAVPLVRRARIDDPVWDHSTYSKNRDRLLDADVAKKFLAAILAHSKVAPLLSDEHFTVDGTLIQAWASMKSFVPKPEALDGGDSASVTSGPPPGGTGKAEPHASPNAITPATGKDGKTEKCQPTNAKQEPNATTTKTEPLPVTTDATDQKSRTAAVDFHGTKRSNATHASTTDPEARLYRKGRGKEIEALLHRQRHDREPAWPRGENRDDAGDPHRRAGSG